MRTNTLRLFSFVTLLALTLSTAAFAQYSIQKIEIHGAAPYTDAEVLQVSGLRPGQMMSHDSLGNAAQHLLDTGVFADASIELTGSGTARTVLIELKPLPASFLRFDHVRKPRLVDAQRARRRASTASSLLPRRHPACRQSPGHHHRRAHLHACGQGRA